MLQARAKMQGHAFDSGIATGYAGKKREPSSTNPPGLPAACFFFQEQTQQGGQGVPHGPAGVAWRKGGVKREEIRLVWSWFARLDAWVGFSFTNSSAHNSTRTSTGSRSRNSSSCSSTNIFSNNTST